MKIIRKGIDPKNRRMTGTCNNCSTEIECIASEAEVHSDIRDGNYYTVRCPVCEYSIYVDSNE